jgi:outer membrane protein TolC
MLILSAALALAASSMAAQSAIPAQSANAATQSLSPPALTLDQAIAKAVSNQPLILEAEAQVSAARAREGEAKSAYLPGVAGAASYLDLQPQEGIAIGPERFAMAPENVWDFHVGVRELVFDFGKREIQVRLAESAVDAASIGVEQIKMDIAFQTAGVFYSAVFLGSEIGALDEQLSTLEQHLEDTKLREQTGSSTRYDVLTTEVRVASVKSQRIEAMGQYQKQRIALRELMGLPDDEDFDLRGSFSPATETQDAKAMLSTALAQRPDIAQSLDAEKQARLGLSLARLGHMPTISTQLAAGYKNGILTFDNADVNKLLFNWNFGLMVDIPIFDGMLTERRSEEADAKLQAARNGADALKRTVTTQVLQALQDLASSHEQTDNSLVQLKQAQEALGMAKIQYDIGVGTNLEYLDSQTSLELAKLNNLSAAYREVLSRLQLERTLGTRIWEKK